MSRNRGDVLTEAVDLVDLPALVAERYPESGAKPGTKNLVFASWRGNENTPAFSLYKHGRTWLWKDQATGEAGNAYDWLTTIEGMDGQEAAHFLIERVGLASEGPQERRKQASEDSPTAKYRPLPTRVTEALTGLPVATVEVMKNRGFTKSVMQQYGIVTDGEDALIPITNPQGAIMQVKRRLANAEGSGKYRYEHKGYGSPAWCSPGMDKASVVWIVEGELNGIIAHAAFQQAGHTDVGVMGVAGAQSPLYPGAVSNKAVLIYADDDPAGDKARDAWAEAAYQAGAKSVHVIPPYSMDFCEYAGTPNIGLAGLFAMLDTRPVTAEQVYGVSDRMVGGETEREVMDRLTRRLEGRVIHSIGLRQADEETGGIREAGLYGVGGLPSMGKSATLRRIWLEHIRAGGTVRVYSPDQGKDAIHRLIAGQLSGVNEFEVARNNYSQEALALYGSPKAAREAYIETYRDVFRHILPRLQITQEASMRKISEDMKRAVKDGVTMFGVDYLQLIRPSEGDSDGDQAQEMQALAMSLKVPVVLGLQLAKSKFPAGRSSGIPIPTDIQGSGAYFQSAEMMFMIYNEGIYRAKYGSPDYEGVNDPPNMARLLLTKDKEGAGDLEWLMSWWPRLATYTDYIAGSPTYDVKRERKGLLPT